MANAPDGAGGDMGFIGEVSDAGTVTADSFAGFDGGSNGGPSQGLADALTAAVQSPSKAEAMSNPAIIAQLEADGVDMASFIAGFLEGPPESKTPQIDPKSKEAAMFRTGTNKGLTDLARDGYFGKDAQQQALNALSKTESFNQNVFANLLGLSRQAGMGKDGAFTTDIYANIDPIGIITGLLTNPIAGAIAGKISPFDFDVNLTGNTRRGNNGSKSGTESSDFGFAGGVDSGVTIQDEAVQKEVDAISGNKKDTQKPGKGANSSVLEMGMTKFAMLPAFEILNGVTDFLGGVELVDSGADGKPKFADEEKDSGMTLS